jgi:hypothetical protein
MDSVLHMKRPNRFFCSMSSWTIHSLRSCVNRRWLSFAPRIGVAVLNKMPSKSLFLDQYSRMSPICRKFKALSTQWAIAGNSPTHSFLALARCFSIRSRSPALCLTLLCVYASFPSIDIMCVVLGNHRSGVVPDVTSQLVGMIGVIHSRSRGLTYGSPPTRVACTKPRVRIW